MGVNVVTIQGGKRKIEVIDIWSATVVAIAAGSTEEIIRIALADFKTMKVFLSGYNTANNVSRFKEFGVAYSGGEILESSSGNIGTGVSFSTVFSIDGTDMIVEVTNNNAYTINMNSARMPMG